MKVIAKNGKIYLQSNFQKLTESEHNFMRDLSYKGVWWGKFDEDGDAPLVEFNDTPVRLSNRYECIENRARCDIEIAEEAKAVFQAQKETAKAWVDDNVKKSMHLDKLKGAVKRAYHIRESGCQGCLHLRLEYGKYICKYANRPCYKKSDEAELEFYANREARILGMDNWYWARPFPVPGCEVLLKGREAEIELQELEEKEKDGENNGKI